MEFWGVEVKPGETLTCDPGEDKYLHISQAALGETKDSKANERVSLYVHIDEQKLMLGTLSRGNCDQISLDLVFEKEFKLSHNLQSGSVFYCGYSTAIQDEEYEGLDDGEDSESEDDELTPATSLPVKENGKSGAGGAKPAKPEATASGKAATKVKPAVKKDEDEDEDDDEDDEEMEDLSDESDDEDEEDESEDEIEDDKGQGTPKVETSGKKRHLPDSATKSTATEKKAKLTTPAGGEKTGSGEGKKFQHAPTPHPAKKKATEASAAGVKQVTPVGKETSGGSKQNTPGSKGTPKHNATQGSEKKTGQFACQNCARSFTTEGGLNSHSAAKHAGGK